MKRCAECEQIKFGFAGFDIKENEEDEWVWICDSTECIHAWFADQKFVDTAKPRWIERAMGVISSVRAEEE